MQTKATTFARPAFSAGTAAAQLLWKNTSSQSMKPSTSTLTSTGLRVWADSQTRLLRLIASSSSGTRQSLGA